VRSAGRGGHRRSNGALSQKYFPGSARKEHQRGGGGPVTATPLVCLVGGATTTGACSSVVLTARGAIATPRARPALGPAAHSPRLAEGRSRSQSLFRRALGYELRPSGPRLPPSSLASYRPAPRAPAPGRGGPGAQPCPDPAGLGRGARRTGSRQATRAPVYRTSQRGPADASGLVNPPSSGRRELLPAPVHGRSPRPSPVAQVCLRHEKSHPTARADLCRSAHGHLTGDDPVLLPPRQGRLPARLACRRARAAVGAACPPGAREPARPTSLGACPGTEITAWSRSSGGGTAPARATATAGTARATATGRYYQSHRRPTVAAPLSLPTMSRRRGSSPSTAGLPRPADYRLPASPGARLPGRRLTLSFPAGRLPRGSPARPLSEAMSAA